ncbi:C-GCAxxG-C-C family protein [bacterium]|nr:C-GCAxxG-C-C family protein [bacterium]
MRSELTEDEMQIVDEARRKAYLLYEGKVTPHRSCGICLAETFGLPAAPFQALRRGGITGEGQCGAVIAGELLLGQLLGDHNPTGPVTPQLREAIVHYKRRWKETLDLGNSSDIVCNHLTAQFEDFDTPERRQFCTHLASECAALVAETLLLCDVEVEIKPLRTG